MSLVKVYGIYIEIKIIIKNTRVFIYIHLSKLNEICPRVISVQCPLSIDERYIYFSSLGIS